MKKKRMASLKHMSFVFLINLVLSGIIAGLYLALIYPYSTEAVAVSGFPIYKGSNKDKVALEFTVSWDAKALPQILDLLLQNNVKATFAVSGEWAENNGELLRRMQREGHELATMGYAPQEDGGASFIEEDLIKANDAIFAETGFKTKLYYCGNRNANISSIVAKRLKLTPIKCTVDLLCANGSGIDIMNRVRGNTNGGDIMLVAPTQSFLDALSDILAYFADRGLTITTVSGTIYN